MMTNLSVNFLEKKVLNTQGQVLPCGLLECECESTSLDPFAYTWNAPHNCIVKKLFDRKVKMINYSSKINQYFFISEPDKNDVINIYRTNVESLFIAYENGFDMNTGSCRNRDFSYNVYQFSVDDSKNIEYTSLSCGLLRNGTHVFSTPWKTFGGEQIEYELHVGAKLDFLMNFNTEQLRHSEMTLLQNQCEIERTQILTMLMLAMQNTRLAGYVLTANRSIFSDTDTSVVWLYHCPKHLSPLRVLKNVTTAFQCTIMNEQCSLTLVFLKRSISPKESHVPEVPRMPSRWYHFPNRYTSDYPNFLNHIQSVISHSSQITTLNARDCIPLGN